jgi:hypothetical protein
MIFGINVKKERKARNKKKEGSEVGDISQRYSQS